MERYVNCLIYGQPGAGKTEFCASAPKPKYYDWEGSTTTLFHKPEFRDIPVVHNPDPLGLFNSIRQDVRNPDVETIVIDSFTTAVDRKSTRLNSSHLVIS